MKAVTKNMYSNRLRRRDQAVARGKRSQLKCLSEVAGVKTEDETTDEKNPYCVIRSCRSQFMRLALYAACPAAADNSLDGHEMELK